MRFSAFSLAAAGIVAATLVVSGSALAVTLIPQDVPGAAQQVEPIVLPTTTAPTAELSSEPPAADPAVSAAPLPEAKNIADDTETSTDTGNSGVGVGNGGGNGTGNEGNGSTGNGNGQGNNGNGQGNGGGNGTGNEGNGNGPSK